MIPILLISQDAKKIRNFVRGVIKKNSIPPFALFEIKKEKTTIRSVLGNLLPQQYKDPNSVITLHKGKGCNECGDSGYLGRVGIFEVIRITPALNKMVIQHTTAHEIENLAIQEGLISMKQDGYLKALEGVTTLEEVLRVAEI